MKSFYLVKASCLDKKGRLISVATNNYKKSHPLQAYFAKKVGHNERIYLHAEIAAILKAKGKEIWKIKIERIGKTGKPLSSYPCPICREAIKAFGIKQIEYNI